MNVKHMRILCDYPISCAAFRVQQLCGKKTLFLITFSLVLTEAELTRSLTNTQPPVERVKVKGDLFSSE